MLVAAATADDAGVVRLTDDLALVQTVDFFTPIVDDPYAFGRIAATNALSDIYAMGGVPVSALNLVAYPLETLGPELLGEILRGGGDAVAAAGASIVGGHSIDDPEPKYGLAVTGTVHPDAILTNAGGRAGRRARADQAARGRDGGHRDQARAGGRRRWSTRAVEVMTTLNDRAAEHARAAGAHALTDVTGFGLLGHVHELAAASGLAAEIDAAAVPAIEGVLALLETEDALAGGSRRNRATRSRSPLGRRGARAAAAAAVRRDDLRRPARRGAGETWRAGRSGGSSPASPGRSRCASAAAGGRAEPEQDPDHAAGQPGQRVRERRDRRQQHEHDRDRQHAEQVGVVLLAAPARQDVAHRPRRQQRQRGRVGRPIVPPCGSSASDGAEPATPPTKNTSSGAHAPWRRSSSQPNRKIALSAATS